MFLFVKGQRQIRSGIPIPAQERADGARNTVGLIFFVGSYFIGDS
jgi:hypothetical protein